MQQRALCCCPSRTPRHPPRPRQEPGADLHSAHSFQNDSRVLMALPRWLLLRWCCPPEADLQAPHSYVRPISNLQQNGAQGEDGAAVYFLVLLAIQARLIKLEPNLQAQHCTLARDCAISCNYLQVQRILTMLTALLSAPTQVSSGKGSRPTGITVMQTRQRKIFRIVA